MLLENLPLEMIVSGGQTGVDRAALDVAIHLELEHGGWCPRGRRAEDGPISRRYQLKETSAVSYNLRTAWNVRDSDGTLILHAGNVSAGTGLTIAEAKKQRRPLMLVDLSSLEPDAAGVRAWLCSHGIRRLNVAGPRESSCPGIGQMSEQFLLDVLIGNGELADRARENC